MEISQGPEAVFRAALDERLAWLSRRGLRLISFEAGPLNVSGEKVVARIEHEKSGVRMSVIIYFGKDPGAREVMEVSFAKGRKHFPLSAYLECKRIKRDSEILSLQGNGESLKERVDAVWDMLEELLEGELGDVIRGEKWLDVPINWEPYR